MEVSVEHLDARKLNRGLWIGEGVYGLHEPQPRADGSGGVRTSSQKALCARSSTLLCSVGFVSPSVVRERDMTDRRDFPGGRT